MANRSPFKTKRSGICEYTAWSRAHHAVKASFGVAINYWNHFSTGAVSFLPSRAFRNNQRCWEDIMSFILIVILILLLFGGIGTYPGWGYSSGWGYGPSGILGLLLVILIVMALLGRAPF
jgi:hypothetical protein